MGNEGLHVDAATAKHVQAQWVCVAVPEYTKNVHFPIKHKQTLKMSIHVTCHWKVDVCQLVNIE